MFVSQFADGFFAEMQFNTDSCQYVKNTGWGWSSEAEHALGMCEALWSIPSASGGK